MEAYITIFRRRSLGADSCIAFGRSHSADGTFFPGTAGVTLKSRAMPPESDHAPTPSIIDKYTDRDGVEKILSNRTLRFARPSEMNDPFDIYIEDLPGMDLEEVHERGIDALCDLLTTNPQEYADRCGVPLESAEASAKILRTASDESTAEIRRYLKSVDVSALSPEYKALRAEQPALRCGCEPSAELRDILR